MKTKQLIAKLKGLESFKETIKAIQMVAASDLKESGLCGIREKRITKVLLYTKRMYSKRFFRPVLLDVSSSAPTRYIRRYYPGKSKLPYFIHKIYARPSYIKCVDVADLLCSAKWGFENPSCVDPKNNEHDDPNHICNEYSEYNKGSLFQKKWPKSVFTHVYYEGKQDEEAKYLAEAVVQGKKPVKLEFTAFCNTVNALEYCVDDIKKSNPIISVVHDPNAPKADVIVTRNSTEVLACLQFKTYSGTSPIRLYRYLHSKSATYEYIKSSFGTQKGTIVYDIGKVSSTLAKKEIVAYLHRRKNKIPPNCQIIDSTAHVPNSRDVDLTGCSMLDKDIYNGAILGGLIRMERDKKTGQIQTTHYDIYKHCSESKDNMKLVSSFKLPNNSVTIIDIMDSNFVFDVLKQILSLIL